MTPNLRELYRCSLLRVLEANDTRWGLSLVGIEVNVGAFGFRGRGLDCTEQELRYLGGKGLAEPVNKLISPENQTWRITAAGRDWLAQNG
jgi:hypothetical protein